MRIEGTLTKWNDDRGFGFITPTQGGPEIFAHVSAFPRDGQRPLIGERVTFEIGTGNDGKKQATNILCPTRPEKPYRLSEPAKRHAKPGLFRRIVPLAFLIALGAYGYGEYNKRVTLQTVEPTPSVSAATPTPFRCDGQTHCSQLTSCAEETTMASLAKRSGAIDGAKIE